jgi:hypothetical protein
MSKLNEAVINYIVNNINPNINNAFKNNVLQIINIMDYECKNLPISFIAESIMNNKFPDISAFHEWNNKHKKKSHNIISTQHDDLNDNNIKNYMLSEINQSDNTIKSKALDEIKNSEFKSLAKEIGFKIDNDLLRPAYITQYISLDNKYLELLYKSSFFLNNLSFQLTSNEGSSSNNVIVIKYPLSNLIRFNILPFTIPYYGVYSSENNYTNNYEIVKSSPNKKVFIGIEEMIEHYGSSPVQKYTILATSQWDTITYDGNNLPNISNIIPVNNSDFTFHYPLKFLTNITISLNDTNNNILLPSPFLYSITIAKSNPAIITIIDNSVGTFLLGNENVIISGFNSSDPNDILLVKQINRPAGYIATPNPLNDFQFSIPVDTTGMIGNVNSEYKIFIPSRRVIIPIVVQQLRPEVNNEI